MVRQAERRRVIACAAALCAWGCGALAGCGSVRVVTGDGAGGQPDSGATETDAGGARRGDAVGAPGDGAPEVGGDADSGSDASGGGDGDVGETADADTRVCTVK